MARFRIHVNRELRDKKGKPMKFYSERDYTSELNRRGLMPYDERLTQTYKRKPYVGVSEEARHMMSSVTYDQKGSPRLGDRYIDALKKMGVRNVPDNLKNVTSGGFYASS